MDPAGDIYKNRADQILFPYWTESPPYLTSNYSDIDADGGNILGRYRKEFSDTSALTVQAYYDYNNREEEYYRQTFKTVDLDIQYERDFGNRNSITMGGGIRQIDGDFESSFQILLPKSTDDLYSAFVQDEINLIDDKLSLTLGVKWEHNDYTGSEWQPSGRLLWKPMVDHSLWTSIASAVRTPSTIEHGGAVLAAAYPTPMGLGTSYIKGNEDFGSEEVLAYELGYRWQTSNELSFDVATFYNDYKDLYGIMPVPSMTGQDYTFVNSVEGDSYGLEFVADWKPMSWWSFLFTYSYLEMDLTEKNPLTGTTSGDNFIEKVSPQHQASVRSSLDFAKNWQTNLWLRYIDEIAARNSVGFFTEELSMDDYFLFDINVIWTPTKNIEIMLAGQNLLNDSQLQYISELITPATEIERSVYAKLTFLF